MKSGRAACFIAASLLVLSGETACGQWHLPPGTSSSADAGTAQTAANADAVAVAAAEKRMLGQDWKGAVDALRAITVRSPKNAHAFYDLGFSLEALQDKAGAKHAYEQADAADSSAVEPRVALGLLLARDGDSEPSAKLLREAVQLPETKDNAAARAQALRALARIDLSSAPDRSREELLAAIKLSDEGPDDMLLGGEIAEAMHDDAAAEQAYEKVMRMAPEAIEAEVEYLRVLVREGKSSEAQTVLDFGLKQHPNDPQLLTEQAALLVGQKQFAEALPVLEKLHAADPKAAPLTRLLARTYVATSSFAKADPLFLQLAKTEPQNGDLQAEWADSLIRQKRNAEAETLLEKALPLTFPTKQARSEAAAELAFAASANHHPDTVVRAVLIRNENLPMDAPSAFLLATAHDSLRHTSQAAGYYRQFLELANKKYPDEEWQATQRLQTLSRAK